MGAACRAGFPAGLLGAIALARAAQLGCLLAVYVVERIGTQEYTLHQAAFIKRFADTYGESAAAEVAAHVRTPRP